MWASGAVAPEDQLDRAATIAISQSGKSPDIVGMTQSARRSGATTIAITNTSGSPLADASDFTIDLHAGLEKSVAATKTFVTSVVAGLSLVARWSGDEALNAMDPGATERRRSVEFFEVPVQTVT